MPSRRSSGTVSMWLRTTIITSVCGASGAQVAVVDGGVGVLLRVEHPHEQVGELAPAGRPRGGARPRSSRGRAGRAARRPSSCVVLAAGGEHRVARSPGGGRGCRATRAAPRRPRDPRRRRWPTRWSDGGRRRRTSSSPVSALNVDDLPEPVAPASATTVWSAESLQPAGGPVDDGLRVVEERVVDAAPRGVDGLLEALHAGTDVGAPGDQLLGPLEQGRHVLPRRAAGGSVPTLCGAGRRLRRSCPGHALAAKRRSSTRRDADRSFSGDLGRDLERVEHVEVARRSLSSSSVDLALEVAAGPLGEAADGLVAEDRLEQLLAEHGASRRRCRPRRRSPRRCARRRRPSARPRGR